MFGYRLEEDRALRQRKEDERVPARKRWPFITTLDLSMVDNEQQLATLVKDRTGVSKTAAALDVADWLKGYASRTGTGNAEHARTSPEGTKHSPTIPFSKVRAIPGHYRHLRAK